MGITSRANTIDTSKNKVTQTQSANSATKSSKTSTSNYSKYEKTKYTYSDIFEAAANRYNISQDLLEAVAYTESSFRANATSYCGAQGLMQLMPATAKSLGVNDAYDPIENVMGGAKYLSQMLRKYNGNTSLALAAYNGGPGNVAKHNGVPSFCQSYVNKVLGLVKKGVDVPSTTVTVTNSSTEGKLMAKYTSDNVTSFSNSSVHASNNTNSNDVFHKSESKSTYAVTNKSIDVSTTNSKLISTSDAKKITSFDELFSYAATKYNVPKQVLEAIAKVQSGFKSDAVSSAGAVGLMQLMPATAKELGVTDSYNPIENVLGGAKYLSNLIKRYHGNMNYAIAAYSAGMGNVDKYGIPSFAQGFVDKVLDYSKKGVNIPNITINNASFTSNNNQSQNNNNNEDNNKKKLLIDIQV